MGQNVIVEKLNRELSEPITSERQVVYILVETRKLLELTEAGTTYEQLYFFCSWAIHHTLKKEPARRIVRLFDAMETTKRTSLPTTDDVAANPSLMQERYTRICGPFELVGFEVFKDQLAAFFADVNVECKLLLHQDRWAGFLRLYSSIIEDCPLKCQDNSADLVKTLLIRKVPTESYSTETQVYLRLQWVWIQDDKTEHILIDSSLIYPPKSD